MFEVISTEKPLATVTNRLLLQKCPVTIINRWRGLWQLLKLQLKLESMP